MKGLFGFLLLLYSAFSFAGATPPPQGRGPDYVGRILILEDRSAIIREDLDTYARKNISALNNTLKQSHINLKFTLAGTKRINRYFSNLKELSNDKEVLALKKKYNADLVYLFSDLDFSASTCGRAYVVNYNGGAFGAGRAAAWLCLATSTFIHEVGHNLGLSHTYSDGKTYASGYGNWAWVTTMSYPGKHGGLITKDRFSNPRIKCDAFYKCGDEVKGDAWRYITDNLVHRFENIRK